jgi:hypothetical protein
VVNRGKEVGIREVFNVSRLIGIIRAVTHRVRVIKGAERWSSEKMKLYVAG